MPRPEKVQAVADIKERIERSSAVFLAEYAGLSVKDQQRLRRSLRDSGAEFKVVKMTLARRATSELEIEGLDEALIGPTGIAFAEGDPVGAAKALREFAKDHEVFVVKGGLLEREYLTPERVSALAEIEPREVLLSKIAGLFNGAMAGFAAVLNALPREMVGLLDALIEKKRAAGEPEGDAAEGDEPAVADEAPEEPAAAATAASDDAAEDGDETPEVEDATEPEASAEAADADDDETDTGAGEAAGDDAAEEQAEPADETAEEE